MGSKSKRKKQVVRRRKQRWLPPIAVVLLLLGLASSIYLTYLYLQVKSAGPEAIDSFCAISEGFDCVTVATSKYSTFLGIPVALFGLEFFAIALTVVLLSAFEIWGLRRWESLLFDATALALPVCAGLAWISMTRIQSVCIMCSIVYGVMVVLFVLLILVHRGQIGELVTQGPKEMFRLLSSVKIGASSSLVAILLFSQLFWMPGLFDSGTSAATMYGPMDGSKWAGHPTTGLSLGSPKAPIFIEEFTDFQCPFCGRAHKVMMQVLHKFPGKIHLVHRDFPLDEACHPEINRPFHPNACEAAYYARCAARQGRYWPMESFLFHNRERLDIEHLDAYASEVGLDTSQLARCLKDPSIREGVVKDLKEGIQRGVKGTPTIFINGEKIVGMRKPAFWEDKINKLLSEGR